MTAETGLRVLKRVRRGLRIRLRGEHRCGRRVSGDGQRRRGGGRTRATLVSLNSQWHSRGLITQERAWEEKTDVDRCGGRQHQLFSSRFRYGRCNAPPKCFTCKDPVHSFLRGYCGEKF